MFPAEWLKQEWRRRGLLKRVHLTISGCLGPCDVPNVVAIVTQKKTVWFGNISTQAEYQSLLDWATRSKNQGRAVDIPRELTINLLENPVSPNTLRRAWFRARTETSTEQPPAAGPIPARCDPVIR
jgi:hypothetical protein